MLTSKKNLVVQIVVLLGISSLFIFATPTQSGGPETVIPLDRDLEPVIVTNVFPGTPLDEIFVYRENAGIWEQMPFQIDEVTSSGGYTPEEDLIMDSNDELVFMIKDLGDKATTSITNTLPIELLFYEVEVTDPLSPTAKGWAYIVRSDSLTQTNNTDYADFNGGSQRIMAENYTQGWATDFSYLNYLSLFGSSNLVDRSKIRVNYHIIYPQTLTEEDFPAPANILIKDGQIRVILKRGAGTILAYASFQSAKTPVDLTSLPIFVVIDKARFSLDMASNVPGAIFFNENVPGGVSIDGNPDVVPPTPATDLWIQISTDAGSLLQITSASGADGEPGYYYKDNDIFDPDDTGDGVSFGDSGLSLTSPNSRYFVIENYQYFFSGNQENRGSEFFEKYTIPPQVTIILNAPFSNYLPVVRTSD